MDKVSHFDLKNVKGFIESLNDRVKHLSVVQSEIANILIPFRSAIKDFDEEAKANFIKRALNIQR